MALQATGKKCCLLARHQARFVLLKLPPATLFPRNSYEFLLSYSTTAKVKYCPNCPLANKCTFHDGMCVSLPPARVKPSSEEKNDSKLVAKGTDQVSRAQSVLAEGSPDRARDLKIRANAMDGKNLLFSSCIKLIVSAKILKIS